MKKVFIIYILLFVPFSFKSMKFKEPDNPCKKDKHYIGELYGGGVIFYLYSDEKGTQHGLIASVTDQCTSCLWGFYDVNVPDCASSWNGAKNTKAYMDAGGVLSGAAGVCSIYEYAGFSDWYLPSIDELNLLFNSRYIINKVLEEDGDPSTNGVKQKYYWSSSQNSPSHAWYWNAGAGFADDGSKNNLPSPHVRAIRSF